MSPSDTTVPSRSGPPRSERPRPLVVALDGPGSSGKSTVGAAVAERLGLRFFDTGLLYRAATWLARDRGVAPTEPDVLVALAAKIAIEPDGAGRLTRVIVDGEDVSDVVRTPEVDDAVSAYAAIPELRHALLERQRAIAADGGIVMAGRDIGTIVLPDADVKVFLDASVEERARRRADERGLPTDDPERAGILAALRRRDGVDAGRPVAPLRPADDAVVVRTDGNSLDDTVAAVLDAIERRARLDAERPTDEPAATGTEPQTSRRRRFLSRARRPARQTPIAERINPIVGVATWVGRIVAGIFARVEVVGAIDLIPRTGPLIIAANHTSSADPVLIGAYLMPRLGRAFNWLGKREVFDIPVLSWFAFRAGVHAVDRAAADIEAYRIANRILEEGHILAIFPEGTRSRTGAMGGGKEGVGALAVRSGAPVVPIGIADSDTLLRKGRLLPTFGSRVTVRVGAPFRVADVVAAQTEPADAPAAGSHRIGKRVATELIMRRIAELLPERQRGVYGTSEGSPSDPV